MNNVLVICSYFPPAGGPGVKRISQFAKYLVHNNWNPIVLTHGNFFVGYDEQSVKQIPSAVSVHRTRSWEQYIREIQGNNTKPARHTKKTGERRFGKILIRHIKTILKKIAPDSGVMWMPFAVRGAMEIYKRTPYSAVFATGSAFSNFLTGMIIKTITGKPLVLDFRDAWAANPGYANESKIQLYMARLYEKIAVSNASYVIANTKGVRRDFLARYPTQDKDKFIVIPNGFDEDDIMTTVNSKVSLDKSKFNIVHTGTLRGMRNPKLFLEAICDLIREKEMDAEDVKIHLVGISSVFRDGCSLQDYIERYRLADRVNLTGYVSRQDAFSYNAQADLLLLVIGVLPEELLPTYGLAGKVYDYILSNRPILALAQEGGATYDLLRENRIGTIADPTDKNDIKAKIKGAYNDWKKGTLASNYDPSQMHAYNMKNLTKHLSGVLSAAVRRKAGLDTSDAAVKRQGL